MQSADFLRQRDDESVSAISLVEDALPLTMKAELERKGVGEDRQKFARMIQLGILDAEKLRELDLTGKEVEDIVARVEDSQMTYAKKLEQLLGTRVTLPSYRNNPILPYPYQGKFDKELNDKLFEEMKGNPTKSRSVRLPWWNRGFNWASYITNGGGFQ